ncbi:MAG TPA: LON peptidase substrate-binding domain-containing protein [Baekduia sp.]|uniref:LON peptidase substrate-binding domain-containing protein n=1 Tax=Baekduia sp. TaxID=2600305 RepID=UPI002B567DF8|nr:LON peptidase substrate-binding domain-containing protein [Baekduia sp.]HMJ36839.1 LON peptidase substrate-binding domain-containing protein [Baekduia sp.]
MGNQLEDFPLFPLGLVAVPHEVVPLHIFEDRYKEMIAECLDEGREFGIVWAAEDGLRSNGCAMEVVEVLERHEDGRLDILTRGTRPFRILEEHFDHEYPAGEIEFLDDKVEPPDTPTVDAAHEAYGSLVTEATDKVLEPEVLEPLTAYEMAATVDFGPDAKQGLLDLRSENARLRLLTRLFRAAVKRLDFIERAQARARSNGKVRFG